MTMDLAHDIAAIAQLREGEARLREAARAIELAPDAERQAEARRLLDLASRVRSERLELLDRCELL
jgi:hypothetical protein